MMGLSDDLSRMDPYIESVTKKIARQLSDMGPKDKSHTFMINMVKLPHFLRNFSWDEPRYPLHASTAHMATQMLSEVKGIEEQFKGKLQEYSAAKTAISNAERKAQSNLLVRSLENIVKAEDIVESENLTTLIVAVPAFSTVEWVSSYETLTQFVVPRSTKLLISDAEYSLYRVVLFKRIVDDFKLAAREKRFTVRDFDPCSLEKSLGQKLQISSTYETVSELFQKWCVVNFSECYRTWIHLKAIRIFVESVLRFGLPASFSTALVVPSKKNERKLRKVLFDQYKHLGSMGMTDGEEESQEEFFPYVSYTISQEIK
eukprot:TRINITY_DN2249_c0_g1_i1.p1 TRINITY_DN2249_c0_g1~~TRINITY_DN2249_c0_g1_i1.p1  ORF type:complete len:316 (-),score=53.94 TRINITY_DN2249_c0_g1_i1:68-1015(-)